MRPYLLVFAFLMTIGVVLYLVLRTGPTRVGNDVSTKPDIILITVDTLRADHLGCYGYEKNTSPHVDDFARESLLFKNCLSNASLTGPAFASILSGSLPHETQVFRNLEPLSHGVLTLPEILQKKGYRTLAVVSNPVLDKSRGWSQGFTFYDQEMTSIELNRQTICERIASDTTDRALELLDKPSRKPIFLWVHYQDPHGPYTPPESYQERYQDKSLEPRLLSVNTIQKTAGRENSGQGAIPAYQKLGENRDYHYYVSQYDGEIAYFDDQFGRLVEGLKKRDRYENSLIFFTGDHGEGMGEHDYYFAHGEYVWHSLLHVPFMVRYGEALQGVRDDYIQHVDIVPTVLGVLGVKPFAYLRGNDVRKVRWPPRKLISMSPWYTGDSYSLCFSLVEDGLKLILKPTVVSTKDGRVDFYNVREDPEETHSLLKEKSMRERGQSLYDILVHNLKDDRLKIKKDVYKPTPEQLEKLEALGYGH